MSSKLKKEIQKLSNRISLLEYQLRDIRHLLKGKGMEIYNSLNPETMVTPKKKKTRRRKARGSNSNAASRTSSEMTGSLSSSSIVPISSTYEQSQPIYVYNNVSQLVPSAPSAAAARYGVPIRRVTPPSPPPRSRTKKKSSTRRASGTKKAPTILKHNSL